jgi:hypothetical protein
MGKRAVSRLKEMANNSDYTNRAGVAATSLELSSNLGRDTGLLRFSQYSHANAGSLPGFGYDHFFPIHHALII